MRTKRVTKTLILPLLFLALPALSLADVQSEQTQAELADKNNFSLSNASISPASPTKGLQATSTRETKVASTESITSRINSSKIAPRGRLLSTRYNQRSSYTRYRDDESSDGAACLYSQNTMTYSCP